MSEPEGRKSLVAQIRIQKALSELKMRGVTSDYCPRCETSDWNVDLLEIPASSVMSSVSGSGVPSSQISTRYVPYSQATGVIPLLGIVCKRCGYTMFHNLNILGIYGK